MTTKSLAGWAGLALLFALMSPVAGAQAPPSTESTPASVLSGNSGIGMVQAPADFQVGAGDVLSIKVENMTGLSQGAMVSQNGTIAPSFLSAPLHVQGATAGEIAALLATGLRRHQIVLDPQVEVEVVQVRSHPVVISGDVHNPQVIQAVQPIRLLDALAMAGGVDSSAASVMITHRDGTNVRLPMNNVFEANAAADNPVLQVGDVVDVIPGGNVYVIGDVNSPGSFPLSAGAPLHVSQILALAHGWKAGAKADHAAIIRGQGAQRAIIPVNLRAVLDHTAPDPILQADDLIYVPDSLRNDLLIKTGEGVGNEAIWALTYLLVLR